MRRRSKLALALGIAVAAHLALFFFSAPKVDGLATMEPEATVIDEVLSAAEPEPQVDVEVPEPLDVGWVQPETPELPLSEPPLTAPGALPAAPQQAQPLPKPIEPPPPSKPLPASKPPSNAPVGSSVDRTGPVVAADSGYANLVRQHLGRYAGALPPGASGEARVQFVVQPDGRVSNVLLVKFSGHPGLDSIALNLPTMAQPLPLPGPVAQRLEVPVQAVAAAP